MRDMFWVALNGSLRSDPHLQHLTEQERDALTDDLVTEARARGKALFLKRAETRASKRRY